jgi:anti-sigma factor ChrR (cupin superfamily)
MNIHSQDQDLLLLAHGELSNVMRLKTQIHVVFCSVCRRRLEKMEGASRLLADTIRESDLGRWNLPTPHGAVAAARTATLWSAAIILAIALTLIVITHVVHNRSMTPGTHSLSSGGCRPDLPSDKCR